MTLPIERTNSIEWAREFLYALLDPKKTPRVPRAIRRRARAVLKHFPHRYDMDRVSEGLEALLGVFGIEKPRNY